MLWSCTSYHVGSLLQATTSPWCIPIAIADKFITPTLSSLQEAGAVATLNLQRLHTLALQVVQEALSAYREEVQAREFPSAAFSPYSIADEERAAAAAAAREAGFAAAADALEGLES